MIRFGPSGIPLSCKGRTMKDGIVDVHMLGLSALEMQLVRTNIQERYVNDEEIGLTAREIEGELIVEIIRDDVWISDLDTVLEEDDQVHTLTSGIAKDNMELQKLSHVAKDLDVQLSIHTPYYMDLIGDPGDNPVTEKSLNAIRWSGVLAKEMKAIAVVTHVGLYNGVAKKLALQQVIQNLTYLSKWYRDNKIEAFIGLELSGKQEVFGSMNEVLKVCKAVKGVIPVLNFAHIHAREGGSLNKPEDFTAVIEKCLKVTGNWVYGHFSGVEHENGNEKRYTPIKKGDLRFEPLAESILDLGLNLTLISGSPLLEHDAMYMKVILERVLTRREAKAARQKAAQAQKDAKAEQEKKEKAKSKSEAKTTASKSTSIKKGGDEKAEPAIKKASNMKANASAKKTPKKGSKKTDNNADNAAGKTVAKAGAKVVSKTGDKTSKNSDKTNVKKDSLEKAPAKKDAPNKTPAKKATPDKAPSTKKPSKTGNKTSKTKKSGEVSKKKK